MVGSEPVVVVVEDDPNISDLVELYLRRDGFRVYQAANGHRGLEVISERRPDLIVLDIGLPGDVDGLEVCRQVRTDSKTPVIFLTARDDEIDRILGLELGADDYVTKPFSPRELVARVKAVLRRAGADGIEDRPPIHELGGVVVDTGRREVRRDHEIVVLAAQEFDLLEFLLDNPGLALNRRQLLDGAWGRDWVGDERTVDVHVRQLRRKLGDDLPLETVWGVGYRLG
ncbi:MAG: response regulator transcription factor [Actinomycetia bacterium]|nr:response regulator transcription factor [Actinomycetes bacterium]MCP3910155.1 response regulator transcription factor [Actinomycetes bacterium]MCP4087689.1 response regulator transcription factor [Actinomycetes bacterium]